MCRVTTVHMDRRYTDPMLSECRSRNGNLETMLDNCWPTVRNMVTTPIQHGATIAAYPSGESSIIFTNFQALITQSLIIFSHGRFSILQMYDYWDWEKYLYQIENILITTDSVHYRLHCQCLYFYFLCSKTCMIVVKSTVLHVSFVKVSL